MALSMGSGDFTQSLCLCGMHFTNSHRPLLGAYFEYIRVFRILLIFPYCSNTCEPVSCLFTAQSYIYTHIYTHVHINTAQSYAHTPIPLYMCSQMFTCACNCQMCLCNAVQPAGILAGWLATCWGSSSCLRVSFWVPAGYIYVIWEERAWWIWWVSGIFWSFWVVDFLDFIAFPCRMECFTSS